MAVSKKTPGINAASMADVSFILLIFFLVVTTMGSDFGLIRQLPPMVDDNQKADEINKRDVFVVSVNQNNDLMVEDTYSNISELRAKTKEFYNINTTGDNFPVKVQEEIPGLGLMTINKTAVVSLQTDRGTSYETYIQVQNELTAAVNELRNEFCMQRFGKKFEECSEEQQEAVGRKLYPMSISEAEPKNIGKTN